MYFLLIRRKKKISPEWCEQDRLCGTAVSSSLKDKDVTEEAVKKTAWHSVKAEFAPFAQAENSWEKENIGTCFQ